MSRRAAFTTRRIPFSAASGDGASQESEGSSAQSPTYSASSSTHVTRYVYGSLFRVFFTSRFILLPFQFVDGREYLTDLISFRLAFIILDVDTRVARPWRLEYCMTRAALAWFPEMFNANLEEI